MTQIELLKLYEAFLKGMEEYYTLPMDLRNALEDIQRYIEYNKNDELQSK
jgi:hypothetical protein